MIKSVVVLGLLALLVSVTVANPASDFDSRRIVNGTSTSIDRIPFQVSILFFNSQWCGASILDETTILTAAHCFDWYFDNLYALTAWTARVGSSYWTTGGQVVGFESIRRHESYDPNTFDYDVAILKLNTRLNFSDTIQPVTLATSAGQLSDGQPVQVSGWGRLVHGGATAEVLQKIVVPKLSRSQCESLFANINPISPRMFCAGDLNGLGDSCNGDSGGPLVDLNYVQYGIVSWGLDCAQPGFTGVYSDVPNLRSWITANWVK